MIKMLTQICIAMWAKEAQPKQRRHSVWRSLFMWEAIALDEVSHGNTRTRGAFLTVWKCPASTIIHASRDDPVSVNHTSQSRSNAKLESRLVGIALWWSYRSFIWCIRCRLHFKIGKFLRWICKSSRASQVRAVQHTCKYIGYLKPPSAWQMK